MEGRPGRTLEATLARIALVGAAAAAAVAARCTPPVPPPASRFAVAENRADCPHEPRIVLRTGEHGQDSVVITEIAVAGPRTHVPEYHDCQRLLVPGMTRYGPLVGIWAAQTVDNPTLASASAELYNWDQRYDRLEIEPQFNCLYVGRSHGTWRAWMVNVGSQEQWCTRPLNPDAPFAPTFELSVHVDTAATDLPSVARWDWSAAPPTQYIGIRCGDDWCEVGPRSGFGSSRRHRPSELASTLPPAPPDSPGRARITQIKGYYDEQRLAPTSGLATAPTSHFGTVFPDEDLGTYTSADFAPGRWPRVAYVAFRAASGGYEAKFNFEGNGRVSQIYLCAGTPVACLPATPMPGELYRPTGCAAGAGEEVWTAMILSSRGVGFHCVVRRPAPPGVPVPATARWRWMADDETVWTRCVDGCCEVQPRP